jgi:hypothetical protein
MMIDPVRSDTAKLIVSTVAKSQKKSPLYKKSLYTVQRHSEADRVNGRKFSRILFLRIKKSSVQ